MLKLNNLTLCALILLPMSAVAQAPIPSPAQTETANEHNAQVAAIEQVMKQYHEAVVTHNGTARKMISALQASSMDCGETLGPSSSLKGASVSGPREFAIAT